MHIYEEEMIASDQVQSNTTGPQRDQHHLQQNRRPYFFIAAQVAQVAQSMLFKWFEQLGQMSSHKEIQFEITFSLKKTQKNIYKVWVSGLSSIQTTGFCKVQ